MQERHGGDTIADTLSRRGIRHLFTLCGGHISPILTGAKSRGIDVVDVRDEASAVFAADAVARLTGTPGVAAVTAGPGVTNAVTAVKNAQMADSPIVVIGGAAATVLEGRGALQDIDQMSLMESLTKWSASLSRVKELEPAVEHALDVAAGGTPGPVFLEIPIDLLYPEDVVREWFMKQSGVDDPEGLDQQALKWYLKAHLTKQFRIPANPLRYNRPSGPARADETDESDLDDVAELLQNARRPALVVGSQALVNYDRDEARSLARAVEAIDIPTFLAGGARGLLGRHSDIQFRHSRSRALGEADLAIIAGFPCDFRLKYGECFGARTDVVSANLSREDLYLNYNPDYAFQIHAGRFVRDLSHRLDSTNDLEPWFDNLREREEKRDASIAETGDQEVEGVNPIRLFEHIEDQMGDDSILVVDGGDFVATGAYVLRPRGPLSWLDPGVFGTLGVGGGFAVGASVARPDSQVWLIWGDGSSAYSLAEFDTCVRHGLAPIAVIGTDGAWAQIERAQVDVLDDDVATTLDRNDYHTVAEGYGAEGIVVTDIDQVDDALERAREIAAGGTPVAINVHIGQTDFREGSISM